MSWLETDPTDILEEIGATYDVPGIFGYVSASYHVQ